MTAVEPHCGGRAYPLAPAFTGDDLLQRTGRRMMEGLDVMLSPTVGISPFEVGAFARLPPAQLFDAVAPLGAFTAMANITGQPALTLPAGLVDGMPVGVQLTGHRDDDARLFALARQIEAP